MEDSAPWLEFVDALRTSGTTRGDELHPYRGLEPFQVHDVDLFCGRTRLIARVPARIDAIGRGKHVQSTDWGEAVALWCDGGTWSGVVSASHGGCAAWTSGVLVAEPALELPVE
ncbi:MAG: hypothetical protein EA388_12180 [Nitriliruptor sp.]|nr:MAG: hypothetical protein EA388_12180 [Nitriliruptor sp.]